MQDPIGSRTKIIVPLYFLAQCNVIPVQGTLLQEAVYKYALLTCTKIYRTQDLRWGEGEKNLDAGQEICTFCQILTTNLTLNVFSTHMYVYLKRTWKFSCHFAIFYIQYTYIDLGSVADPDPVGFGLFGSPGSGSGKIPDPDPDPLSTKRPL